MPKLNPELITHERLALMILLSNRRGQSEYEEA